MFSDSSSIKIATLSQSLLATICLLAFSLPAHAYVDPGTGSMAVQLLIGGVVALAFTIKTYYYAIRAKMRSIFGRSDPTVVAESESTSTASTLDKAE